MEEDGILMTPLEPIDEIEEDNSPNL